LLVIVKDSSTGNAIEGATVNLQKLSPVTDNAKITGGSLWSQQSWQNFSDSSNIDNTNVLGGIRLAKSNGNYASSGYLVSSTFDTGTNATNYTTLAWQPTSQDPSTTLKLQVATNNDNQTWDFTGPDGTSSTFYTVPGTTISSANNGNRYIRFKVYLATTDSSKTPVLTSVNVNYVSGCFTPGQAMFEGLLSGSGNYQLVVSMSGYQTQTISGLNIQGNQTLQILLSHQ
jgi:hypothetical protein